MQTCNWIALLPALRSLCIVPISFRCHGRLMVSKNPLSGSKFANSGFEYFGAGARNQSFMMEIHKFDKSSTLITSLFSNDCYPKCEKIS